MKPRFTTLVIGTGSIGERHARCFLATNRTDVIVCEANLAVREAVCQRLSIRRSFGDVGAAIEAAPNVAVVATPASSHVPLAIQLARAGIHVLIEKPLSVDLRDIDELELAVRQAQVTTAVAYVYRAHPALAAMRSALLQGRFGKPVELVAVSGQHFPTYRPAYREIYYADRAQGGGAIQDALTHNINACEWLAGPVTQLVADAAHLVLPGVGVEDTAHLIARHGGVLASYALNQHQAPNETTITVVCEQGTARFEPQQHRWRWMQLPEHPWHDECCGELERDALFTAQAHAFLDAVEGRAPPLCSLREGLQTLRVNLAALRSLHDRAWQTIDCA